MNINNPKVVALVKATVEKASACSWYGESYKHAMPKLIERAMVESDMDIGSLGSDEIDGVAQIVANDMFFNLPKLAEIKFTLTVLQYDMFDSVLKMNDGDVKSLPEDIVHVLGISGTEMPTKDEFVKVLIKSVVDGDAPTEKRKEVVTYLLTQL